MNLSGGQKQRISLARAMAKSSSIIILDDCLSAVDSETEQLILNHLEQELSGKTLILITQRLKQTQRMDHIFVFDHGSLVDHGSFQELIEKPGLFSQLYAIENKNDF